jgi:formylmethanofuran dehydrogenase subunit E
LRRLRCYRGEISLEDYFDKVVAFHGFLAPGVVLGGFMVDWAMEALGPCELLDAVVETRKCLPDAVQLLTPCSIGNGWLRILDWGKLVVTLYDKETLNGARVHLDLPKTGKYPKIKAWAMKEVPKKENPLEALVEEITHAGRDIFTCRIGVLKALPAALVHYGQPVLCRKCGEAFRFGRDGICMECKEPFFSAEGE